MAHQYSRVGFDSSVEVNEVNLSLYYGGVLPGQVMASVENLVLPPVRLIGSPFDPLRKHHAV